MSPARKKKRAPHPATPLGRLVGYLRGTVFARDAGRPFAVTALLAAAIGGAWCVVWPQVRGHVLSRGQYVVGPQQVEITTPLPPWINAELRTEVFRNTSLEAPLSILDDDLTERIGNAFSLHPWVAEVPRVSKHHPARVEVELVYRRPVCMVEVSGRLFPVDSQGVLLPGGDFSPVEAGRYPRLLGVEKVSVGTLGESWGDPRVAGGAAIADALLAVWEGLELAGIVPSAPSATGVGEEHTYTLVTRGGTRVLWGRAPGTDAPGELAAADKVTRLQHYLAQHGTLEGRDGRQELDVHRLQ